MIRIKEKRVKKLMIFKLLNWGEIKIKVGREEK